MNSAHGLAAQALVRVGHLCGRALGCDGPVGCDSRCHGAPDPGQPNTQIKHKHKAFAAMLLTVRHFGTLLTVLVGGDGELGAAQSARTGVPKTHTEIAACVCAPSAECVKPAAVRGSPQGHRNRHHTQQRHHQPRHHPHRHRRRSTCLHQAASADPETTSAAPGPGRGGGRPAFSSAHHRA